MTARTQIGIISRRMIARLSGTALAAVFLAGCGGGVGDALGLGKSPPDEFAIVTKAPLAIPPDYSLRPPQPGAPPRASRSPQDMAQGALYPGRDAGGISSGMLGAPGGTPGEVALLESAGAMNASPEVRRLIESEYRSLVEANRSFADRIIFWRDAGPPANPVDAAAERQRLRQNDALGAPVTEGETPRIEPRERGLLEDIF